MVITTKAGPAWQHANQLGMSVHKWRDRLDLRKSLTLKDARGTCATRLLNANCSLSEISAPMGWSIKTTAQMIEVYPSLHPGAADSVLVKLADARDRP